MPYVIDQTGTNYPINITESKGERVGKTQAGYDVYDYSVWFTGSNAIQQGTVQLEGRGGQIINAIIARAGQVDANTDTYYGRGVTVDNFVI